MLARSTPRDHVSQFGEYGGPESAGMVVILTSLCNSVTLRTSSLLIPNFRTSGAVNLGSPIGKATHFP